MICNGVTLECRVVTDTLHYAGFEGREASRHGVRLEVDHEVSCIRNSGPQRV